MFGAGIGRIQTPGTMLNGTDNGSQCTKRVSAMAVLRPLLEARNIQTCMDQKHHAAAVPLVLVLAAMLLVSFANGCNGRPG
jgi:hypothetical protein